MMAYAKIFIDRPGETLGLVVEVQGAVGAPRHDVLVAGRDVEVDIRRNPDAGWAEGFLGFPLLAEVYPKDGCADDTLIEAVGGLTTALDAAGFSFVTAADFEDRLPNQGRNVAI